MVWEQIDRRALAGSQRRDDGRAPVVYGRVCEACGHWELSEDPLLVVAWRECPSCTVRRSRDAS
jgi:hypothetical protein